MTLQLLKIFGAGRVMAVYTGEREGWGEQGRGEREERRRGDARTLIMRGRHGTLGRPDCSFSRRRRQLHLPDIR